MKSRTDPADHLLQVSYAASSGNTSAETGPTLTTYYGYDAYGRLQWEERGSAPRDSVQYDLANRVIKAFPGGQPTPTVFTYDIPVTGGTSNTVTDVKGQVGVDPVSWTSG